MTKRGRGGLHRRERGVVVVGGGGEKGKGCRSCGLGRVGCNGIV